MTYLKQFKKEEPELFNDRTGEYYKGTRISSRQCELMRDTINELEQINSELLEASNQLLRMETISRELGYVTIKIEEWLRVTKFAEEAINKAKGGKK
jgi:hypothetical protein